MDQKHVKPTKKFFKLLPTAVNFQNPAPFSPGRDHRRAEIAYACRLKAHEGKGFSVPVAPMIPPEARIKLKNVSFLQVSEPTSPKVSCIGQIKQKKKKINKSVSLPKDMKPASPVALQYSKEVKKQSHSFKLKRIFASVLQKKVDASDGDLKGTLPTLTLTDAESGKAPPSLSQMKRFASGRESLGRFDWASELGKKEVVDERCYYSDQERGGGVEDDEDEEEIRIPFSEPILIGGEGLGLQPKKEINLWKRRTMALPRPLEIH